MTDTQSDWYLLAGLALAIASLWIPVLAILALIIGIILLARGYLARGLIVSLLATVLFLGALAGPMP